MVNARKSETIKRAMKALILNRDVRRIIAIMLIPTRVEVSKMLMGLEVEVKIDLREE